MSPTPGRGQSWRRVLTAGPVTSPPYTLSKDARRALGLVSARVLEWVPREG